MHTSCFGSMHQKSLVLTEYSLHSSCFGSMHQKSLVLTAYTLHSCCLGSICLNMFSDDAGIERLEGERQDRADARAAAEEAARAAGEALPGRRGLMFSETMKTLTRLSSSYRRCHWKSACEIIFPLIYQHLTFASHRTWRLVTALCSILIFVSFILCA